jgi:stringent starvation protein B
MRSNNADKHNTARVLLVTQASFMVHFAQVDTEEHRLVIPRHLWMNDSVVFEIGNDLPTPIPDLEMNDLGFTATLSFRGKPFRCSVPWEAVYAIVGKDMRGRVWGEDMPPTVKDTIKRDMEARTAKRVSRFPRETLPDDSYDTQKTLPRAKAVSIPPGWKVFDGGKATRPD